MDYLCSDIVVYYSYKATYENINFKHFQTNIKLSDSIVKMLWSLINKLVLIQYGE